MEENKDYPSEISSVELNKKRKLQEQQLGLPSPKHKFRERSCGAEHKSPITDDKVVEDKIHKCPNECDVAGSRIRGCECIKESVTATVDAEDKPKIEMGTNYLHWPFISSSSSSINDYRNNYYSPASITIKSGEQSTHVEYKNDDKEQCLDVVAEEIKQYSNDVMTNYYDLSSGIWNVTPDDQMGARKPTIDQEFEQYFSTLLL